MCLRYAQKKLLSHIDQIEITQKVKYDFRKYFEEWQINENIMKKQHEAKIYYYISYPEAFWVSASFCL